MTQTATIPLGSRALVTGGAGGVGFATARALLGAGYRVQLFGRTPEKLEAAAELLDGDVTVAEGDVGNRADLEDALEAGEAPRILVNAAGIAESSPLLPPDDELWDRTLSTNVTGIWVTSTACLPGMIEAGGGVIVNIASTAALRGYRYTAAYVASKHGALGLARAMTEDLAGKAVRIHTICPGFLDTPMTDRTIANVVASTGKTDTEARALIAGMNASGKLIRPEAVAKIVLDLVQDESRSGEVVTIE